jgi:micrococcal nuclease
MTPPALFHYRAKLLRVVDGDTIDVSIDLGFRTHCSQRLRLVEVDTPERGQQWFKESTDRLIQLLGDQPLLVNTISTDAFGRWLSRVWVGEQDVSAVMRQWLVERGL